MQSSTIFVICVLCVLVITMLANSISSRSYFSYMFFPEKSASEKGKGLDWMVKNNMYQYDSPRPMKELKYYVCLTDECNGDVQNFECLERCRLKTFLDKQSYVSPIKEYLCGGATNSQEYYDCLANLYSSSGSYANN